MYQSAIPGGINCLEGKYTLSYFVQTFATYTRDELYLYGALVNYGYGLYGEFRAGIEKGGICNCYLDHYLSVIRYHYATKIYGGLI